MRHAQHNSTQASQPGHRRAVRGHPARALRRRSARACDRRRAFGFTLVELMVVVTIMVLLMLILLPAFGAMRRSNRQSGGQNAVLTGVIAARAYATRNLQGKFIGIGPNGEDGRYSGVAMLFTPAGEIRIVENIWNAVDNGGTLLETKTSPQNGFADILVDGEPRDYIDLPRHVGVVGIARGGLSAELKLLPPPFAVRFDENGHLVSSRSEDGYVFYDGDIPLDDIQVSVERPGTYDPALWSPLSGAFDPGLAGPFDRGNQLVYRLPFDKIETVIGVLVYDGREFTATQSEYVVADGDAPAGDAAWLLENGKPMLFSRYSGTLLR